MDLRLRKSCFHSGEKEYIYIYVGMEIKAKTGNQTFCAAHKHTHYKNQKKMSKRKESACSLCITWSGIVDAAEKLRNREIVLHLFLIKQVCIEDWKEKCSVAGVQLLFLGEVVVWEGGCSDLFKCCCLGQGPSVAYGPAFVFWLVRPNFMQKSIIIISGFNLVGQKNLFYWCCYPTVIMLIYAKYSKCFSKT